MRTPEQLNKVGHGTTAGKLIASTLCLAVLGPHVHANAAAGWVIGWGDNVSGEATAVPSFPSSNGTVVVTGSSFATGTVKIANSPLTNAVAISAGWSHSLALLSDGTVVGWGGNYFGKAIGKRTPAPSRAAGKVDIPNDTVNHATFIAADRDFSLALKNDGTVVTWGENKIPEGVTNIAGIAAEEGRSWALTRDGTVIGWLSRPSDRGYGQLLEVKSITNAAQISVGPGGYGTRGIALAKNGAVIPWGTETTANDARAPEGLTNVVAVAAGYNHSLALRADGTVIGWGFNHAGQATGIANTNAISVSSGEVSVEGRVLTDVAAIAAGHGYSLAIKKDGTVVGWGRMVNDQYPVTVPEGLSNVIAISAGYSFCLAITTNRLVAERFGAK